MVLQLQVWAFWLLQEAEASTSTSVAWDQHGLVAKTVIFVLFIMSAWSIGVMIDRMITYNAARKQSRAFAPAVAGALREGKLDEAIKIADRFNKSHLAKVVVAGLQEFKAHQMSWKSPVKKSKLRRRALERAEAIVHAELKRGVSSLATIGSTGSVRRTVRNGFRHHERVQVDFDFQVDWFGRCRRRYFGSAGHHRLRSFRRYPGRLDVQLLHQTALKRLTWKWATPVLS